MSAEVVQRRTIAAEEVIDVGAETLKEGLRMPAALNKPLVERRNNISGIRDEDGVI